ncbi:hypothetical protein SHK09_03495 [Polaribacter sp. PL03]|uniref:hypothetical protein n=1 Tax=Polaribacter sp. PL03 TaxID=3088353 RepID=UPI0029D27C9C|nr:hypothetical protein [Polaribacter sp. PL03]MDX6745845.1 hypothetical protein [Polaribacter sp. PL03]
MISIFTCAQNAVNVSFHQDLKLLVFGDKIGNDAGTLNYIIRTKYEAREQKIGYFIHGLEYEKAMLKDQYSRFGGFTGFTFTTLFDSKNIHITPTIGAGSIHRTGKNMFSWSASLQIEYLISNRVRISALNQITQRTDLKLLYNDLQHRYSFFIGLEVNLFKIKKR